MSTVKNLNNFPFAAIIGQEEMKLALQLNVIDPKIGGVMIMGDRGTGKSTTIRALADLLPDITIIKNDDKKSYINFYYAGKKYALHRLLYLNFKEKCFLGNNGSLLLAFVISYFSIDSYNKDLFFVDEIIIFMLIPGVDLIRLFFLRISRGLSPMNADKEHLHHYLTTKFSLIKSNFLIAILIFTPTIDNTIIRVDYEKYKKKETLDLDRLLEKIEESGIESLTIEEKYFLDNFEN